MPRSFSRLASRALPMFAGRDVSILVMKKKGTRKRRSRVRVALRRKETYFDRGSSVGRVSPIYCQSTVLRFAFYLLTSTGMMCQSSFLTSAFSCFASYCPPVSADATSPASGEGLWVTTVASSSDESFCSDIALSKVWEGLRSTRSCKEVENFSEIVELLFRRATKLAAFYKSIRILSNLGTGLPVLFVRQGRL